jgi:hypothetical protein
MTASTFIPLVTFLLLLAQNTLLATELLFTPSSSPVTQQSTLTIEVTQNLPHYKFDVTMKQTLEAEMTLLSGTTAQHPGFDLLYQIKDMAIDLQANDTKTSLDTKTPGTSLLVGEMSDLVDRSFKIHIDPSLKASEDSEELKKIFKELPHLQAIFPSSLFQELFLYQFAIAGKSLEIGKSFPIDLKETPFESLFKELTLKIDDIGKEQILATIEATYNERTVPLKIPPSELKNENPQTPELKLSGNLKGNISWQRNDAMKSTLQTSSKLLGDVQYKDHKWAMTVNINHSITNK